jgi:hypothetical protein
MAGLTEWNDLAMFVGQQYRWPSDFADEARIQGVSKAIPKSAIPLIEPGHTRLACIHPKAIAVVHADGMTLHDLAEELVREHTDSSETERNANDLIGPEGQSALALIDLLKKAEKAKDLKRLEEKYEIEYLPGFFGFTYVTGLEYVCNLGETELPEELADKGIEPVIVEYADG